MNQQRRRGQFLADHDTAPSRGTGVFEALALFGEALAVLPVTRARLAADPETIALCADRAVRKHLRAYERTAYGRAALKRAKLEPDSARVADLIRLTPLTKAIVRDHFAELNTAGLTLADAERLAATSERRTGLREVRVLTTSGTQGCRSVVITTPGELFRDNLHAMTVIFDAARGAGLLGRPRVNVLAIVGSGASHVSNVSAAMLARLPFVNLVTIPAAEPAERLVNRVRGIRPDVVVAYGSRIRVLANAQARGDLDWGCPLLLSGAERLDQGTVQTAARLGWPCWDAYGCTEAGTISAGRAGDMRVLACEVVVEPVDRYGSPVPRGTWSDAVLVTKLTGGIQPLVRFRLDDEVRLLDVGETLPRLEIRGRSQPEWRWPGGVAVEVRAMRQALDMAGVAGCLVRQTAAGVRAEVSASPGRVIDADGLAAALAGILGAAGLASPEVTVTPRAGLGCEASGKESLRWLPMCQDRAA